MREATKSLGATMKELQVFTAGTGTGTDNNLTSFTQSLYDRVTERGLSWKKVPYTFSFTPCKNTPETGWTSTARFVDNQTQHTTRKMVIWHYAVGVLPGNWSREKREWMLLHTKILRKTCPSDGLLKMGGFQPHCHSPWNLTELEHLQ